jgi:TolA-binding protein
MLLRNVFFRSDLARREAKSLKMEEAMTELKNDILINAEKFRSRSGSVSGLTDNNNEQYRAIAEQRDRLEKRIRSLTAQLNAQKEENLKLKEEKQKETDKEGDNQAAANAIKEVAKKQADE